MEPFIIANPPVGIYRGDMPLGYAYLHTLLDIYARFKRSTGREVSSHRYSLNVLGKRAENLGLNGTVEDLHRYAKEWIDRNKIRNRMGLSLEGSLLDSDQDSIHNAQEVFLQLDKKGYLIRRGHTFYLDIPKINTSIDVQGIASQIRFYPARAENEFKRMIIASKCPIRLTKDRIYAAKNPLLGEPLSPIFVVSNIWESIYNREVDLISSGEKEMSRYLLLRFYSIVATSDNLPMKEVFIYNLIEPIEGTDAWNLEFLLNSGVDSDSLRYAFVKSHSLTQQKTQLDKKKLIMGKNFVYLVGNIKNFFLRQKEKMNLSIPQEDRTYDTEMDEFRFNHVLSNLEKKFHNISSEIQAAKKRDEAVRFINKNFAEYIKTVRKLFPFCPFIADKVLKDLEIAKA